MYYFSFKYIFSIFDDKKDTYSKHIFPCLSKGHSNTLVPKWHFFYTLMTNRTLKIMFAVRVLYKTQCALVIDNITQITQSVNTFFVFKSKIFINQISRIWFCKASSISLLCNPIYLCVIATELCCSKTRTSSML